MNPGFDLFDKRQRRLVCHSRSCHSCSIAGSEFQAVVGSEPKDYSNRDASEIGRWQTKLFLPNP